MLIGQLEFDLDRSIMTQRILRMRIGAADVSLAMDRVASKLQKKHQVPGFRKGKAPLAVVRKHCAERIAAEAFQELKQSALEQVFKKLDSADQPLIPPELLDEEKVKPRYREQLEFAVKYLIDPSGMTRNPKQPEFQQGAVMPGAAVQHRAVALPEVPGLPKLPA